MDRIYKSHKSLETYNYKQQKLVELQLQNSELELKVIKAANRFEFLEESALGGIIDRNNEDIARLKEELKK